MRNRLTRWIVFVSCGLIALGLCCLLMPRQTAAEAPPLGINLSGITYYSSEVVFVDVFKQSQPWTSQAPGKPYGQGGPLKVNALGWVEKLNGHGQFAESLMFVDLQGHYPSGDYVCLYEGGGEIDFAQAARVIERKPGRMVVHVEPKNGPIALRLLKTDPDNPIRNIRLVLPGHEKTYREQPFSPDFLKRWTGFKVLRLMDWSKPNDAKTVKWSDRITPAHTSQGLDGGVALEYQLLLANTLKADPWLCIPYRADDDYVREFARFVRENLNQEAKLYLEYANECWHGGFEGGRYCLERGKELKLSDNAYEAQIRFYTQRSVEIFRIVEKELGKERLVRILQTPPDSTWAVKTVLDWKDANKDVDAIAIAPYFGGKFGNRKEAAKTANLSVDELLDACEKEIDAGHERTREMAKLVKSRGLKLLAYEGGQHLVGSEGEENNEKLTKLFHAANRHPRMKDLYLRDLKGWSKAGGELFCVFASTGRYSKWGAWGVLEYSDQDESTAPKLAAIRELMKKK